MGNLRQRIGQGLVQAPGASDPLVARLIERQGFEAVYMTGFGATATTLGMPDLGLLTQSEMVDLARRMVQSTKLPIIADADTGYGGLNNLYRTVKDYAQSGIAAIHLEDQALPKRCGQLSGVRLISAKEHAARIQAALAANAGSDMMIIARTDALGVHGLTEAVERANRYAEAGADMVFVDGVKTIEDARAIGAAVKGPKVLSIVDGLETSKLTRTDIAEMGFDLVFYALTTLFAATKAVSDVLGHLREAGETSGFAERLTSYGDFQKIVDLDRFSSFEHRFDHADDHQ